MNSIPKPDVQRLIESYQDYAHAIAAEVSRKLPSQLDRRELEGAADLGLVEAAQAFDPSRGVLFKTFAYYRIRGAVYDALRKMGWFSKSLYQQYKFEMAANEYLKDHSESTPAAGDVEAEYEEIKNFTGSVLSCYLLSIEDLRRRFPRAATSHPSNRHSATRNSKD
jgi:RNA polymerase sigma factor for flagellar operon FliA